METYSDLIQSANSYLSNVEPDPNAYDSEFSYKLEMRNVNFLQLYVCFLQTMFNASDEVEPEHSYYWKCPETKEWAIFIDFYVSISTHVSANPITKQVKFQEEVPYYKVDSIDEFEALFNDCLRDKSLGIGQVDEQIEREVFYNCINLLNNGKSV